MTISFHWPLVYNLQRPTASILGCSWDAHNAEAQATKKAQKEDQEQVEIEAEPVPEPEEPPQVGHDWSWLVMVHQYPSVSVSGNFILH